MFWNLIVVGFLILLPRVNPAGAAGTDLRCAAKDRTSATTFVLIRVVNTKTDERFSAAVTSKQLHSALALEHEVSVTASPSVYYGAIFPIIDQHPDLEFQLSFEPAVHRLRPVYTEVMLDDARRDLENLDDETILKGFALRTGSLHSLYKRDGDFWETRWRRAVTHALLERGFSVGIGDYNPDFLVSRSERRCQ